MRNAFLAASLIAMLLLAARSSGGDSASPSVTVSPRPTRTPTRTPTATRTATPTPIPTPLPSSDPLTAPFELPVLMYHDVSDTPPNDIYRAPLNVKPDVFSTQLDYLECAGYTAITPSRMAEAIAGRGALPPKPVILTFDDGYADQYTDAFPILERHGMTGAFSIITGYVEADGEYMTWSQIETMAGAGMEMMSHTVTHVDLNVADDATALGQLRDSRLAITAHTGRAPAFLVYPSGEPFRSGTAERQAQVVSMAAAAGYSAAFLAGPASTTQDPSHPFQFNRLRVEGSMDLATFAAMVGGPPPADCAGLATPATGPAYGRGSATSEQDSPLPGG